MAVAGPILFPRAAGGLGAGSGVHVADRCLHAADLSAGGRTCGQRRLVKNFSLTELMHRESRRGQRGNDMSGNLHVGLAAFGAAIAVGLIGMKASDAVGRNPVASTKVLVQSILAIAFAEAIVFYTLFLVK